MNIDKRSTKKKNERYKSRIMKYACLLERERKLERGRERY
jgi:hypothetical protein